MPFKKTNFFPLYVAYVDQIFNPHIPQMRIIRIFHIRMASHSKCAYGGEKLEGKDW